MRLPERPSQYACMQNFIEWTHKLPTTASLTCCLYRARAIEEKNTFAHITSLPLTGLIEGYVKSITFAKLIFRARIIAVLSGHMLPVHTPPVWWSEICNWSTGLGFFCCTWTSFCLISHGRIVKLALKNFVSLHKFLLDHSLFKYIIQYKSGSVPQPVFIPVNLSSAKCLVNRRKP